MEIAFFDLETTVPTKKHERRRIIQIGIAIVNVGSMSITERFECDVGGPEVAKLQTEMGIRINHISPGRIAAAKTFAECSGEVVRLMDGRIWAGHNIVSFDIPTLMREFEALGSRPPRSSGAIDTYLRVKEDNREEDRSAAETGIPPRRRPANNKLAEIADFFGMMPETHSALDDAILSFEALERFLARTRLRNLARDVDRVSFFSAASAVVTIDVDTTRMIGGYYPRGDGRIPTDLIEGGVWITLSGAERDALERVTSGIRRKSVTVADFGGSLLALAEMLRASNEFPRRRARATAILRDTPEWMYSIVISACARGSLRDMVLEISSDREYREVVLGNSVSPPHDAPGTSVAVKFRYSKQVIDPTTGRLIVSTSDRTAIDPKRNLTSVVPAFDAKDATTGTTETFVSSRVISIQSVTIDKI